MDSTALLTDLHIADQSVLTNHSFDYTPAMNTIIDALHKRIYNLEVMLQTNNQVTNHSHSILNDNLSSNGTKSMIEQEEILQKFHNNLTNIPFQQSRRNVFMSNQSLPVEQQFYKLHLSSNGSIDPSTMDNADLSDISLYGDTSKHSLSKLRKLPPVISSSSSSISQNRLKTYAYELAAVFENTFDQLNIIYQSLSTNSFHENNYQDVFKDLELNNINGNPSISYNSSCNAFSMNQIGVFIMNEHDKLRDEIKYFFHILLLLFRAILLESQTDFVTCITNMNNNLPSIQLIQLYNRLKESQNKIKKLTFMKTNFRTEKSDKTHTLLSIKSELNGQLMEDKYRLIISSRYCNNWKTNHISQWIEMLLEIEKTYSKTIHEYENMIKQTEIAHHETIKILTKQKNEIKSKVNKWHEYYQNETNRFEKELTNFRQEFYQVKRQRQKVYEEYQRMKIIVDEYNQMKIDKKLFSDKQKHQEEAIKCIQAWWRGTRSRRRKQKRRRKKKK